MAKIYERARQEKKHFMRGVKVVSKRAEPIEGNEDLRVEVRFSSNKEIPMWYANEILLHDEENVDLSRFNSGSCPVMKDHRWSSDYQIGVVESARVDGEYGYAVIRFSKNEEAFYNDVIDGIRDNVSVGYDVKEYRVEDADSDSPTYIATLWIPREISFVPFPADESVGPLRSVRSDIMFPEEESMPPEETREETTEEATEEETTEETTEEATSETPEETTEEERGEEGGSVNRSQDSPDPDKTRDAQMIIKLCEDLDQLDTEKGLQAIRDGKTFEDFQAEVIEELATALPNADGGFDVDESVRYTGETLEPKDRERFSLLALVAGEENTDGELGGFEREICKAEKERLDSAGIPNQGYTIPGSIVGGISEYKARKIEQARRNARALTFSTDSEGGHLVDEVLLVENFIDILYANHPVSGAANWIHDVMGTIAIPKQDGRVVAAWTTETGDATESTPSFELIQMSPKELRGMVHWSRTFAILTSISAENIGRRSLIRQSGETADEALLYGTGLNNSIQGVSEIAAIKNSPFNQRTRYAAGGITYKECVNAMATIGNANAMGPMAKWILSWNFWQQAMTTTRLPHGDVAILDDMGMIAGFMAEATSQCKNIIGTDTDRDQAFFANWEHLLVPMWGGIDIVVDPSTLAHRGEIRVVSFMRIDTGIAHDEAFHLLERTP